MRFQDNFNNYFSIFQETNIKNNFAKKQTNWVIYYTIPLKIVVVESPSCVQLFATPWTVALQAPLSMGFPRQEYWSGLPFPSPRVLPDPGVKPESPVWQADSLPLSHLGSPSLEAYSNMKTDSHQKVLKQFGIHKVKAKKDPLSNFFGSLWFKDRNLLNNFPLCIYLFKVSPPLECKLPSVFPPRHP